MLCYTRYSRGVKAAVTAGSYSHVIALSSMAGKNFLARLGAELDVSPITDVVSVVSAHTPHCTID
eukprot:9362-Heterococcus_DN1.PRE.2